MKDFQAIIHSRNKSANNRYFGGFLIFIRNSIRKGLKIGKNEDKDIFELTLLKKYFDLHTDLKLIFGYASPFGSCYVKTRTENAIDSIERKLMNTKGAECLIMGDLNGRTKLGEDFVRDQNDEHSPINNLSYMKDESVSNRENMDQAPINQQGKKILDLCKYSSYRILNGRSKGDKTGKYTRYPRNLQDAPSVIDYALCSATLIPIIHSFSVLPFTGLSDHCGISICIRTSYCREENALNPTPTAPEAECKLHETNTIYSYDPRGRDNFIQNILCDSSLTKLIKALHNPADIVTRDDIDNNVTLLNNILLSAAKKAFTIKKTHTNTKGRKRMKKGHIWFNNECLKHRKVFKIASSLMSKYPFDKNLRLKFLRSRAKYKKTCRMAERDARRSLTNALLEVGKTDPKKFWNIIDKMNKWGKDKEDPSDKISPSSWKKHFENLLNGNDNDEVTADQLHIHSTFEPSLDGIITNNELEDALKKMKCKKSPGPDGILTEYLKIFGGIGGGISF